MIEKDRTRFRRKIKQDVRDNLRRYITNKELVGGGRKISIPWIDIPRFKHMFPGGVSQGDGDIGDILGGSPGSGGDQTHEIETEVTIDEVAEVLAEELELPFRKSQKGDFSEVKRTTYKKVSRRGVIKHFKRSYLRALARGIASGTYNPDDPIVIIEKQDLEFKVPEIEYDPKGQAVIIWMMDVSGSMKEMQKTLCRTQARWGSIMIGRQYPTIENRFIIHSGSARETDEKDFYRIKEAGGTVISSAYKLCDEIIEADYSPDDWDIYPFHFTDGDNQETDVDTALSWLETRLLPKSAAFCYGQCPSAYISEDKTFIEYIAEHFDLGSGSLVMPKLRLAKIENEHDHIEVLRTFLSEDASHTYNVFE